MTGVALLSTENSGLSIHNYTEIHYIVIKSPHLFLM